MLRLRNSTAVLSSRRDRVSAWAGGGFCLCLLGIAFLFAFISYHFFIFCSSWLVMVLGIIALLVIVGLV